MAKKNRKEKKHIGEAILVVFLILVILCAAAAAAAYVIMQSYYSRSNYVADEDFTIIEELPTEEELESEEIAARKDLELSINDVLSGIREEETQEEEVVDKANVYNILLIGSDRRDASWYGNSDAMILLSVNPEKKTIKMISFMRDLYAVIPGFGANKLNSAYAHGGGPLLVQTIEQNFMVDIDNWASIDFSSMQGIINDIGGITIQLNAEEAQYLNAENGWGLTAGSQWLNGEQALAYSRIRHVGNYDYERTSRQRRVLEQILLKVRGMGVSQINAFVQQVLPLVTHNINQVDLVSMIAQIPAWIGYDAAQDRIPYDGLYSYQGEMLVPDFRQTIVRLQSTLYGD